MNPSLPEPSFPTVAMTYCPHCAHRLDWRVPDGDNRPRHVCPACSEILYQNPRVVVGTLCTWEDRILLCRRAIEPRYGLWTLPAGFLELGESVADGAIRETDEEAGARIEIGPVYSMIDVLHAGQVHIFYRARMTSDVLDPGPESLEARLFPPSEIPWDTLAFKTVIQTLKWFIEDRQTDRFPLHTDVLRMPSKPLR